MTFKNSYTIHCIGDVTLDHHFIFNNDSKTNAKFASNETITVIKQIGGAGFTSRLINEVSQREKWNNYEIDCNKIDFHDELPIGLRECSGILNSDLPESYSIVNKKDGKWRVDRYIGIEDRKRKPVPYDISNLPCEVDYTIVHDYRTFSHGENKSICEYLSKCNASLNAVFLRLGNFNKDSVISEINRWPNLGENICKKLITFTTINNLRSSSIPISQGLSWEKTIFDIINAFDEKKRIRGSINPAKDLLTSRFIVVMVDRFGCLIVENKDDNRDFRLVYNSRELEDNNEISIKGEVFGLISSTMVHVLKSMIENNNRLEIDVITKGLINGLNAVTKIFNEGFQVVNPKDPEKVKEVIFPFDYWHVNGDEISKSFQIMPLVKIEKNWSIVQHKYPDVEEFNDFLRGIVINGLETEPVREIPIIRFGKFTSADRFEIEQLLDVKKMIEDHLTKSITMRPLSIAVLGMPGSGKSFGIREMISSIENIKENYVFLEFNLTQFSGQNDLMSAFNEIRNPTLEGKHVLVFWDEFDSSKNDNGIEFGWIKNFLAPMQDGFYYEGPRQYSLGSPIFFFGSSKASSWGSFIKLYKDQKNYFIEPEKFNDFLSRIHGHIEIKGINPMMFEEVKNNKKIVNKELTIFKNQSVYLRRSMLIRSLLEKHAPGIFVKKIADTEKYLQKSTMKIDSKLLDWFLFGIKEYRYEIRSLESIIQMSQLQGKREFTLSSLSTEDQIKSHIGLTDKVPK